VIEYCSPEGPDVASGTRPGDEIAYALLADGTAIQIRPARQED
jgi:hypothetical protein